MSDKKARLDNLAIELQRLPNTRGFIIVYRSRRDLPGINNRLATVMKDYLVNTRGLPAERVITVDGGEASCLVHELWVTPVGSAPTPRSDAYSGQFTDIESVRKFDEYYYYYSLPQAVNYDDEFAGNSHEAFATALQKEPRAQAYIIAYSQYYIERWDESADERISKPRQRVYLDSGGTALRMLRKVKAELVTKYGISPSRIKVMDGGYRKLRQVELWIVPRGEHAPIPTPNAFPKKGRAR